MRVLQNEGCDQRFEYLQIGAMDAWTLFMSLDKVQPHLVTRCSWTLPRPSTAFPNQHTAKHLRRALPTTAFRV